MRQQLLPELGPAGSRVVLLVDDNPDFCESCITRLEEEAMQMNPDVRVTFATLRSRRSFDEMVALLEAEGRLADVVYALVDLKLPTTAEQREEEETDQIQNGCHVLDSLRRMEKPTYLVSSVPREQVNKRVRKRFRVNFVEKKDFSSQS